MDDQKKYFRICRKLLPVLFFGVLFATGTIAMVFHAGQEEENLENRTLAEFSGEPAQFEEWLNDHAPFRSQWLNAYAVLNYCLFGCVDNEQVIVGKDGWFFYTGDSAVSEMLGVSLFTEEEMKEILKDLLAVREQYVDRPEDFALFVAPDKEKIYSQYLPAAYENKTKTSRAAELVRYIREHSDIQVVYPVEKLKREAEGSFPLYYKTDTHWNRLGAFVGVQELIDCLGGRPCSLSELTISMEGKRTGDLILLSHLPEQFYEDPDPLFAGYYDEAEISVLEEDLLGTGIRKAVNKKPADERTLVMVRDSFGDAMNTSLCRYFKEVTSINWEKVSKAPGEEFFGDLFVYEIVERRLLQMPDNLKILVHGAGKTDENRS